MHQMALEKQVVQIDLSKGLDEVPAEELAPWQSCMTVMENVVMDNTGEWVKRPGLTSHTMTEDATGVTVNLPHKNVRLTDGLGLVAGKGSTLGFYQLTESENQYRKKSPISDVSASSMLVGSTGSRDATAGVSISAVADSTIYTAVAYLYTGIASGGAAARTYLAIREKESGQTMAKYPLDGVISTNTALGRLNMKMVVVGDQYLMVFLTDTANINQDIYCFSLLLQNLPADLSAVTPTLISTGLGEVIVDVATDGVHAILLTTDLALSYLYELATNCSTVSSSGVMAPVGGIIGSSLAINYNTNMLWVGGTKTSGKMTVVGTTIPVNSGVYAVPVTPAITPESAPLIAVDGTDKIRAVCYTTGTSTWPLTTPVKIPRMSVYSIDMSVASVDFTVIATKVWTWAPMSHPFYCQTSGRFYLHVSKGSRTAGGLTPSCVIDVTEAYTTTDRMLSGAAAPVPRVNFRIACSLELYQGYSGAVGAVTPVLTSGIQRIISPDNGVSFSIPVPFKSADRGGNISMFTIKPLSPKQWHGERFGNTSVIGAGTPSQYDGTTVAEQGFLDIPWIEADLTTGAALTGSFKYLAVFRYVDGKGNITYSRVSDIISSVVAGKSPTVYISFPHVNSKEFGVAGGSYPADDSRCVVDLYRTADAGTIYYLLATSSGSVVTSGASQLVNTPPNNFYTFVDGVADATLQSHVKLFRQPGVPNAPLDRYPPPPSDIILSHKDRIFCTSATGDAVYYSSFAVDGEGPWYSPAFAFFVHGGTGPITGLASMDGRLVIFKQDSIFTVDGDGPPENGGTGAEFSPPQRLSSELGCIDHRSIVNTPMGVFYRSPRGIELLTRSLQVQWVGDRVQRTVNTYPTTIGAVLDRVNGRVLISLAGTQVQQTTGQGRTVCYDLSNDSWSTWYIGGDGGTPATGMQSLVSAPITTNGVASETIIFSWPTYTTAYLDVTSGYDSSDYVAMRMETGWVKANGPQGAQRVYSASVLGKKVTNHSITISIAYNYSSSYTQTGTWEPATLNSLTPYEVQIQPSNAQSIAMRFKVVDAVPADSVTYPPTTGLGLKIWGIGFEMAQKAGIQKLAEAQRG